MRYYPAFGIDPELVRDIVDYRRCSNRVIVTIGDLATKFATTPNWTFHYV
jgi:hypothetical protein